MGQLVDGKWVTEPIVVKNSDGRFRRKPMAFRNWIKADGSTPFAPDSGRYHLYAANACPWAHRVMIFRKLRGLEEAISLSIVDTLMFDNGWQFREGEGYIPDTINEKDYLYEVYAKADPTFTGRVTVPVIWDKQTGTIVNNESSEIIRMLNSEFTAIAKPGTNYYPDDLSAEIDEINERVYHTVNNGVYKSGFARTQAAYEEAVSALFDTLDWLEEKLDKQRYLAGNQITEADWRLFTTLVRFDPVYVGHFKCNIRRIADYQNLPNYLRELYQHPGIAETVNLSQIKEHYYRSHESINPSRVVPIGPAVDYTLPHNRDRLTP